MTASADGPPTSARPGPHHWPAVLSVMMGIFVIVTTEILPIGLLTSIGSGFTVSDGTAGLMMTMPGYLAAAAAPAVTVATARIDRRLMLCACMFLLAAANFIAAAAPAYWAVLVSRVLVGVVIGGFWSIGAGLAGRLVPARSARRATAVVFSAVPLGSVLGVPLGTLIGDLAGWRTSFAVMGLLSVAVLIALAVLVPPLPAEGTARLTALRGMMRSRGTRHALLVTVLVVLAHFGAYTYVTPFLERVTHVPPGLITVFLLTYGAAGILGNFLAGTALARHPHATFGAAGGLIAFATLALPLLGRWDVGAIALLVLWGVGYGAVPVCSQAWFARAAPHAPEAASVLFTASFQATLSTGALVGGAVMDRTSPSTIMTLGGATAVVMVVAVVSGRPRRSASAAGPGGGRRPGRPPAR
ncbi:putative MFS family arabinose efflux permease [Actinomadura luteofluorescens]|uniref:Putative MFS family arabinose efflux permease n=1 Tax=Actinomadura luteofluorescens TaxID=46163 RepID=A0A7Y9EAT5_9ACTN|nr:MFS transporter [Actinomadura luteofluorescens]NYD44383.1 putative MFS family arabinose efflux permease [Actinomadura luteofluorescens]